MVLRVISIRKQVAATGTGKLKNGFGTIDYGWVEYQRVWRCGGVKERKHQNMVKYSRIK